jgi:hypothetical protein
VITHYHDLASNPAWIADQLELETEGQFSPIQIRADFTRAGFYLEAPSGEPIGKVYHNYKFAVLARASVMAELAVQS